MQRTDCIVDNEKVMPTRPVLGRRVTCQYYSPALVLSSNDEKRFQVVLELLQTEEKYTCCLHTLKSVFEANLKSSNLIPLKDIESIFPSGLKEIREIHDRLCSILKERIQQWNYRSKIGDIFVQFFSDKNQFDLLGHYSSYSNNFPKAIRTISRCSRNSIEFEAFLQNCSNGPSWKGLDLHALLLNPIQRLPRYLLLLKQLIRFTDFNHPDRAHVEQALVAMSQTVTVLNNSIESSLKVACEYTTRKRLTKRRASSVLQRDSNKSAERVQLITTKDIKLRTDENRSTSAGQSRPASICSSVSSGYASGEEGETQTLPPCPCNGPSCNAKQEELSRLVKELKHETALEQLARQKFDFSVSCISPTLQRLREIKRGQSAIPETGEKVQEKSMVPGQEHDMEMNTAEIQLKNDSTEKARNTQKELPELDIDNIDKSMENFIEDFSTTISNIENLHLTNLLSASSQPPALTRRSFSDGLPLGDQASCNSERDLGYHSPMDETPLSSRSASNFQRFTNNRRSWAPQSSLSKHFASADGFAFSPVANGENVQNVDDDNVSIWSGLSTLSGESVMSGGSAMSVPVDGKHATKKRYFKLKDFFKTLRGTKERRSPLFTHQTTMPTIEQEDSKPEIARIHPRMMISSV